MGDIEKALKRVEILRRDCRACGGKGWVGTQGVSEQLCETCGGSGQEEKEVPFRFDQTRPLSREDINEIWGEEVIPAPKPVTGLGE